VPPDELGVAARGHRAFTRYQNADMLGFCAHLARELDVAGSHEDDARRLTFGSSARREEHAQ
jgi:hypothetical protein